MYKQMKRKLVPLLIICSLILTFLCSCGQEKEDNTEYVAVVSAMDNEIDLLIKEAEIDRVDKISEENYYVGKLSGKPVVIVKSGIGKIRAASVITSLFDNYKISKLIFTGIAGGVADEVKVLDEVVATRLLEHDYGIMSNEGFVWRSGDPGFGNQDGVYYFCDSEMVELAYSAAVSVVGEDRSFKGTIATGDQFIASEEYVERLRRDHDAYACEMEGAAVAVVCIKYRVPFVVIRALSDKADGNAHESYENFGDIAANNSSRIVIKLLQSL